MVRRRFQRTEADIVEAPFGVPNGNVLGKVARRVSKASKKVKFRIRKQRKKTRKSLRRQIRLTRKGLKRRKTIFKGQEDKEFAFLENM